MQNKVNQLPLRPIETARWLQENHSVKADEWIDWWTQETETTPPPDILAGLQNLCLQIHQTAKAMQSSVSDGAIHLSKSQSRDPINWVGLGRALHEVAWQARRPICDVSPNMTGWQEGRNLLPWATRMKALARAQGLNWTQLAEIVGPEKGPIKKRAQRVKSAVTGKDDEKLVSRAQRESVASRRTRWMSQLETWCDDHPLAEIPTFTKE